MFRIDRGCGILPQFRDKSAALALLVLLTAPLAMAADAPKPDPAPEYQYQTEGIAISIPSADEPKVAAFNADTIKAAATYLEDGAICWVREKSCVNCHTTGPYMSERPALSAFLGKPDPEVLEDFVNSIPGKPSRETEKDGLKYYPGSWSSVWRSLGLAEWDRHVTGGLSEHTDRSLREMFLRQPDQETPT